jgi:EmrB/QacA subfamily drug resistance transporter
MLAAGGLRVTDAEARLDRRTILALAAMGIAVLVVANDFTALSVALPTIERDLDTTLSTAQWVINAYALVFGVLIVTGGRLADAFGRRRTFVAGAAIFAGFSLLGGLAPDAAWLIACRAAMGVGGALMWPAVLGMTYAVLPKEKAGLAGGLILGAAGLGNAVGPLVGGVLTDALSWRWILVVNLPVAVAAVVATLRAIPPDAGGAHERMDVAGVATLSLGLLAALVALDQSSDWGWGDPRVIGAMAAAAVLLVAFALRERRAGGAALVPADVMGNRTFAAACLAVLLMSAVFFATLLYLPQFMAKELGYGPLQAGAGLLPMMATFALVSFVAGPLYAHVGPKLMVSAGAACIAAAMVLLSGLEDGDGFAALVPGMVVLGVGIGVFYSSVTTAGVTALDDSRSSLAGGIVYMFQIAGGSVGLGINTAIVAAAGDDLVEGIARAFRLDAALAVAGLLVALGFIGGRVSGDALRLRRPHLHRAHP